MKAPELFSGRLLLHVCCAPCATTALERAAEAEVGLFYYNPNIQPEDEYRLRLSQLFKLQALSPARLLKGNYRPAVFLKAVQGLEQEPEGGKRCEACFALRLREAARAAKKYGYESFATTLTVSPHKNAALINRLGEEAGRAEGIPYIAADLKKQNGYGRSVELSGQLGLYRQQYCGCCFSNQPGNSVSAGKKG